MQTLALAAVKNVIFPIPKWDERTMVDSFPAASEVAILVLTCIACVVAIGFMIYVIINLNHQVIMCAPSLASFRSLALNPLILFLVRAPRPFCLQ